MKRVVVGGALSAREGNGGGAWVRSGWVRGLALLGFEVHFVDVLSDESNDHTREATLGSSRCSWFVHAIRQLGMERQATLLHPRHGRLYGRSRAEVIADLRGADLFVNLGGHIRAIDVIESCERSVYVDLDPGFTQIWHAQGFDLGLERHTDHFSVGLNVGRARCAVPTGGFDWKPVRPPVVLDQWPSHPGGAGGDFTTIGTWRGPFGRLEHEGRLYGLKHHEFRALLPLPSRSPGRFRAALRIHPADDEDRRALLDHGWVVDDPRVVAHDPRSFRRYVQCSGAELSAAQGIYVQARSGWFSDRTARYLASGKPTVVQDTGVGDALPTGEGLLPFSSIDEAVDRVARVRADYARHSEAARRLAEEWFDSNAVLGGFLSDLGLASPVRGVASARAARVSA